MWWSPHQAVSPSPGVPAQVCLVGWPGFKGPRYSWTSFFKTFFQNWAVLRLEIDHLRNLNFAIRVTNMPMLLDVEFWCFPGQTGMTEHINHPISDINHIEQYYMIQTIYRKTVADIWCVSQRGHGIWNHRPSAAPLRSARHLRWGPMGASGPEPTAPAEHRDHMAKGEKKTQPNLLSLLVEIVSGKKQNILIIDHNQIETWKKRKWSMDLWQCLILPT